MEQQNDTFKIIPRYPFLNLIRAILGLAFAVASLAGMVYISDFIGIIPAFIIFLVVIAILALLLKGRDIIDELRITPQSIDFYAQGQLRRSVLFNEIQFVEARYYHRHTSAMNGNINISDTKLDIHFVSGKTEKYAFSNFSSYSSNAYEKFRSALSESPSFKIMQIEPNQAKNFWSFAVSTQPTEMVRFSPIS